MTVDASIGVSLFPQDAHSAQALLARADAAMYAAKRGGRGGFRFCTEARNQRRAEADRRSDALTSALSDSRIALLRLPVIATSVALPVADVLVGLQLLDDAGQATGRAVAVDELDPALAVAVSLKTLQLALDEADGDSRFGVAVAGECLEDEDAARRLQALLEDAGAFATRIALAMPWRRLEALSPIARERLARFRHVGVVLQLLGVDSEAPLPCCWRSTARRSQCFRRHRRGPCPARLWRDSYGPSGPPARPVQRSRQRKRRRHGTRWAGLRVWGYAP